MSTPEYDHGVLADLRQQARLLVGEVAGPLRRIQISRGDAAVEIEWHGNHNGARAPAGVPDPVPRAAPATGTGAGNAAGNGAGNAAGTAAGNGAGNAAGNGAGSAAGTALGNEAEPEAGAYRVVSPMVGTFYRAPEPGASPFVAVGDVVEPDRVIGVVEAMKLMNEVTAGQAGRVLDVLVDDGQPVEFGQALIALAPP
jgi:acetyl-CoA carboxylase biotin carboxyl carrier protein